MVHSMRTRLGDRLAGSCLVAMVLAVMACGDDESGGGGAATGGNGGEATGGTSGTAGAGTGGTGAAGTGGSGGTAGGAAGAGTGGEGAAGTGGSGGSGGSGGEPPLPGPCDALPLLLAAWVLRGQGRDPEQSEPWGLARLSRQAPSRA